MNSVTSALEITGLGILGVFLFMSVFYLVILLLQKLPEKKD